MYYDKHGRVMAAGAEADSASIVSQVEDEEWIKTELYVYIFPYNMQSNFDTITVSSFVCGGRP